MSDEPTSEGLLFTDKAPFCAQLLSQLQSVQRSTVMFNSHAPPGGGASSAQGNYAMSLSVPSYSASSAEFMNFSRNTTACMKCALVVVEVVVLV